ncbi:MAG: amino acid adenylation domain-containing protein [Ruminococcus sp.]|nr:amino acid adenylation domain-containing protein [Ruminococcus sp.]
MGVYHALKKAIEKNLDKTIIFDEVRPLTAKEFDLLINTIAVLLPESARRIGVMMDHSVEMIAAIFAVLKSGAAYIPVEPSFPRERIAYMMEEAQADCIITNTKYREMVKAFSKIIVDSGMTINENADLPAKDMEENSLAYILYTSGSTGKPKGVSVTHKNLLHYVSAFQEEFYPNENDIMLQYSVCSFDIFVEEVFTTLLSGAALAIPSDDDKSSIEGLMKFIDNHHVTMLSGFPYLLQEMNGLESIPKSLRLLISGGDVIRQSYVDRLVDKVTVYNTYGPSETTVCASYYNCSNGHALEDGTYPVGKAVEGASVKILDENGKEASRGEIGEICIFGGGVSQGYIGDRAEENKAFVTLENGERMYRSGDLGYLMPDGNLAFVRRKDTQVMILSKRVEADEVQSVILGYPDIHQAAVVPYTDSGNLSYLVAYIVPENDRFDLTALKEYMTMYLTEFMIPEFFVTLDKLPLIVNGKLDKDSLPVPKRVEVKNVKIQDIDLLLDWRMEVLSHVFSEEFKSLTAEQIETIRENNRRYFLSEIPSGGHIACFVYRDGEIVGCGGVCIYDEMPSPDNLGGKCAYLMNIYTRPEYRHQGIATRVVEHLIAEAKARSIEKIYLETSADGERMYRRLGFKDMKGYMKL